MANQNPPQTSSFYPTIKIDRILNPNRFYAFPFIGGFVKIIMIIPIGVYFGLLSIANFFIIIINSFFVLFTGKYWKVAYELNLGLLRLSTKISFFFSGLTNKYPGFSLTIEDEYSLDINYPENPNRLFALPILGFVARFVLLIPYFVYAYVIQSASNIATLASSLIVLVKGYYPETTFELNRDSVRLSQATTAYIIGLSDKYPNFWISMNHKRMKIFLIILGIISIILNSSSHGRKTNTQTNYYHPVQYKSTY